MTKRRPRPHIPISVRVQVAERQHGDRFGFDPKYLQCILTSNLSGRLRYLLTAIGFEHPQLDHDPALILRKFNPRTGKYSPDANDPAHLLYLEKADHQQKTTGRKPGAERTITTKGSDIYLKAKFDRLEGRTKRRPKAKIPQRKNPWAPGRKIPNRRS